MAEYYEQEPQGGRDSLKDHLLQSAAGVGAAPGRGHQLLAELPIREVWTTNYDPLIEQSMPGCQLVVSDDDTRLVGHGRRAVVKMHGSIDPGPPPRWASEPVISRTDYERYELNRPGTWALLRASYLTRTFLFLGFSFADPNIDVLLRLARAYGTTTGDRHLTVMRRPKPTDEPQGPEGVRLHDLKVRDLEASGVAVHEIDEHSELVPLLAALVRRTRPLRLFVAGSGDPAQMGDWANRLAQGLGDHPDWELASLGGDAGWLMTRELARLRRAAAPGAAFDPSKLLLYFRRKDEAAPTMDERAGTAVFTDLTREELYPHVMSQCRAVLVVGGGTRTFEEAAWAQEEAGLGVVPLAASGGAALQVWQDAAGDLPILGGRPADANDWARLNDDAPGVAVQAAVRLLRQAMYRLPT